MDYWINRMIEHIKPALADEELAADLLREFWKGRKIDVWSTDDVMSVASDNNLFISEHNADEILDAAINYDFNARIGISYGTLEENVWNFCEERDHDVPVGNLLIGDVKSV